MKRTRWRLLIGAAVYAAALVVKSNIVWLSPLLFGISFLCIGGDIVYKALRNISQGRVFDENFLMSIATIGAFIIGEYPEGVAVMLFYQVGELFQSYAVDKSRKSIADLMDICPDYANVKINDEIVRKSPEEVQIGDLIVIKAGEKIPLDGTVIDGNSMIDTSALTGESVPREAKQGDDILSGCININGVLTARVTKIFGESTVSKILDLVENASSKKSNSERFITKFARYYTPVVVIIALLMAVIPPMIFEGATYRDWIYRALSFLVVSCPCALVVSIPLSFFSGLGGASRKGVLIKGSNYLELMAQVETIVFDKTGTLTKGVFKVQHVESKLMSPEELLMLTAFAESYSNHPISVSLRQAYGREIDNSAISSVEEVSGHGVIAQVMGRTVAAGNGKLMASLDISYDTQESVGTVVHIAVDGCYAGYIVITDEVKEDSARAISELKHAGIKQTVMLTGDNKAVADKIAGELGLDKVYSELLPGDKVDKLEELFTQKTGRGKIAFVGDGINDAPVLARADVGVAMGGLGSDAAIEAADIVIMTDEPSRILTAIKISKKTLKIANQNIVLAIGIKILVLLLSAAGIATMWVAVFADVGVTVLAVINSFRALQVKKL